MGIGIGVGVEKEFKTKGTRHGSAVVRLLLAAVNAIGPRGI
jgi:hypothetical protein